MRLLGRKLPVPSTLVRDLRAEATRDGDDVVVRLRGETMESGRVVDGVRARWADGRVEVTILASLPFWRRGGGTLVAETVRVHAPGSGSTVVYREPDGKTVPLAAHEDERAQP